MHNVNNDNNGHFTRPSKMYVGGDQKHVYNEQWPNIYSNIIMKWLDNVISRVYESRARAWGRRVSNMLYVRCQPLGK